MAYWLVKSEPDVYSWDTFVAEKQTYWNGVRNYQARNNMKAMRKGDTVMFYHSNEERQVVGLCTVVKEAYQDPTTDDPAWVVVDVKAGKRLKTPVTLATIKQTKGLEQIALIKQSRLSVMPLTEDEFNIIIALGS
ncbi:MAG: EVE domain-containing protein [Candidatus Kapabacteria bacterium]|nr:EVE domain-containing protein [Candidatus Kapabacteria bacterium]